MSERAVVLRKRASWDGKTIRIYLPLAHLESAGIRTGDLLTQYYDAGEDAVVMVPHEENSEGLASTVRVSRAGRSARVTLSAAIARAANIGPEDEVEVRIESGGRIVVRKVRGPSPKIFVEIE